MLGIVLTVVIMVAGNWFVLSKVGDLIKETTKLQLANQPIVDSIKNIASHLDKICTAGSGIIPA